MADTDTGPAELIMGVLSDALIGTIGNGDPSGWRLATGKASELPDRQVCCYDSPGQDPNPKWLLDYPCVQVLVRGPRDGYQDAQRKMKNVYDTLLGSEPITNAAGRIDAITVLSTPSYIGDDKNNRPLFSANFRLIFEPNASPLTKREPL